MSKCECKNCVHYEVCRIREFPSIEEILKDGCNHYKDKSLMVELPCKVEDEVWLVTQGRIVKLKVEEICIYNKKGSFVIETDWGGYYSESLGELIFLTKEEAIARLKEIERDTVHKQENKDE